MFKSASIYRIGSGWIPDATKVEAALAEAAFVPCGPTQLRSTGWTEPRGKAHGALLESVAGQWILKVMTEKKDLPGSVVAQAVQERLLAIEENEGRKVGKKELREIKESVTLELLPKAFAKRSAVSVWIDPSAGLLVIDSTSSASTDTILTMLVKAIDGFAVSAINTTHSPAGAMSGWLTAKEIDENFDFGGECELEASDEGKASVKYARHRLDIEEIGQHIVREGKSPKALALVWSDRVGFVLNKALQLKKIKMIEDVMEAETAGSGDTDPFDANVAIFTGEFSRLIPHLIGVLGGEVVIGADLM